MRFLTEEFYLLFPKFKDYEGKIVSRNSPLDKPAAPNRPVGCDEGYDKFEHNQKLPLIAICLDLNPMTEDILKLYKHKDITNDDED